MGDAMDVDNTPSPLVIRRNPGKLVDIATVSFVSDLLRHKIQQIRENDGIEFNIDDFLVNLTEDVLLPPDLEATITELPKNMITNRTQWWAHHHEFVFSRKLPADIMIDWLDHLVWLPDGAISYRQTAKKLLNSGELTNVQMFKLACEYCFVEDVEFLKETLTGGELNDAIGGFRQFDDLIQNYWCGKLRVTYKIDLVSAIGRIINSSRHYYYDEWSAIGYFFNRLNNEERFRSANIILNSGKPRLTWNLLAELTGPELDVQIRRNGREIITTLVKERCYFEYAVLIWNRIVNLVDDVDLGYIMHCVNDSKLEQQYVNSLLWEMWLATSEPQKKFIANGKYCKNLIETPDHPKYYPAPNFPLILDVLSRSQPNHRHQYWSANWPSLVIGQSNHLSSINRIMKLCLETDEKIEDFKKTMIDYKSIAKFCERLITCGRIKEIQIYLEFCTSKEKTIRDLKKEIITTMKKKDLFTFLFNFSQDSSISDFYRYLEEIRFTKKRSESFVFKVITHAGNLMRLRLVLDKRFQEVVEFVEKFITDEENVARVKLSFFQRCRRDTKISISVQFDLMAWCFNGDQNIVEKFKGFLHKPRSSGVSNVASAQNSVIFDGFMKLYLRRRKNDGIV